MSSANFFLQQRASLSSKVKGQPRRKSRIPNVEASAGPNPCISSYKGPTRSLQMAFLNGGSGDRLKRRR